MPNWTEEQLQEALRVRTFVGRRSKPAARGRRPQPGVPNKTETAYMQYLDLLQKAGEITYWGFEAIKIRIGNNCFFTPDFLIMLPDGRLELHDTKAPASHKNDQMYRAEDDAIVKARSVGANFPIPVFFTWKQKDGSWAKREM